MNKLVGYTGKQACTIVGISYRQLDYWARTDLLRPSIEDANGTGTKRLYSFDDLINLKVIKQILDAGISLQSARRVLECLEKASFGEIARCSVVVSSDTAVLAYRDDDIVDLVKGGQGVLNILPLAQLVSNVATQVKIIDSQLSNSVNL